MQPRNSIGIVWPGTPSQRELDEVRRFAPPGVGMDVVATRDTVEPASDINLKRALSNAQPAVIAEAATELVPRRVAAIGYACTSVSYVRGVEGAAEIARQVADATGLPATTTSTAMANALRSLGVGRVAVLSPHVDELNERLEAFLRDSGFEVARMVGLGKISGIDEIPADEIEDLVVREADHPDADGVFVSCTSMKTSPIIESAESAVGKPVVTANQATVWESLRMAGFPAETPGLGTLFRGR